MPEKRIVGSIGSPKRPILISLSDVEGARVVDIRRYYIDKESKELRPTQKGVSIKAENFAELFACLSDAYGPITEWLHGNGATNQVKRQGAAVKAMVSRQIPQLIAGEWRGGSFFKVESHGAEIKVSLRADHPFVDLLKSVASSKDATQLIADVLSTFRSAAISATVDDESQTVALHQLEAAWSNQLGSILKSRKGL